jgi:hypothetical protein
MRTIRHLCATALLVLALAGTTFAGEIQTPSVAPTPQRIMTGNTELSCEPAVDQTDTPLASSVDTIGEITLTLVASMMSIF